MSFLCTARARPRSFGWPFVPTGGYNVDMLDAAAGGGLVDARNFRSRDAPPLDTLAGRPGPPAFVAAVEPFAPPDSAAAEPSVGVDEDPVSPSQTLPDLLLPDDLSTFKPAARTGPTADVSLTLII